MSLIEIKNLTHAFNSRTILDNISFSLEKGNIYSLMGPNGSGKTTLFNIITRFLNADSGNIHFKETETTNLQPFRINRLGIGRTFQDLRLITKLTVRENILLAMKNNKSENIFYALKNEKPSEEQKTKAENILKKFFLEDVGNNFAGEISYGQQKLLTLACCIANDAELLLLDEPVAGINPNYRNKIKDLIVQLKAEGKTILLIEHNTEFLEQVSDKLFFLNEGSLMEFENYNSFKNNSMVHEAYL